MHVFYVGTDSSIVETYNAAGSWARGTPGGQGQILPSGGGSGISSMWDGAVQHVYYTGSDGNLWEDYNNGRWWSHALTGTQGAVSPQISAAQTPWNFSSSLSPSGAQTICGVEADTPGNVSSAGEMRCIQNSGSWQSTAISVPASLGVTANYPVLSINGEFYIVAWGTVAVFLQGIGSTFSIMDDHFTQLTETSAGAISSGPGPVGYSGNLEVPYPITGFYENGYTHVFYVGQSGGMFELYKYDGGSWNWNLLSTTYPNVDVAIY